VKTLTILLLLQLISKVSELATNQGNLMSKIDEATVALQAMTEKVAKISAEVQALIDAVAGIGETTPEFDAALATLQASLQGLDDKNPDAP
jgi:uncharacterized phage infection (PIP) family protein YhgE